MTNSLFRHLPAIDQLNRSAIWTQKPWPEGLRTTLCREALAEVRTAIIDGALREPAEVSEAVERALKRRVDFVQKPSLRAVLNGTGVLIHTNAGRAPLSADALEEIRLTAGGYCNLELSLDSGERGSRHDHVVDLARWLFGAEDALVVSNGAGALMLALHGLARERKAVISRGELVEIGGSFRVPEVMRAAGVQLVEVGTTNRTWPRDYEVEDAAVLLQVHRSNFKQEGFVHAVEVSELSAIAKARGVPLIVDLGSGVVDDLTRWRLDAEPTVRQTLAAGADVVTFSGDKLLGGPQAGFIVGRRDLIQTLKKAAMARALRVDSLILAALASTLRAHLQGHATSSLPLWRGVDASLEQLRAVGDACAAQLQERLDARWTVSLEDSACAIGGGAHPGATLPSLALFVACADLSAQRLAQGLRVGEVSVLSRPRGDGVLIDLRSLWTGAGDDAVLALIEAFSAVEAGLSAAK